MSLSSRSIFWNTMISSCIERGEPEIALSIFARIQTNGIKACPHTFVCVLKACASIRHLGHGKQIHALLIHREEDFLSNIFVSNSLLSMYGKCGDITMAESVFVALRKRSVISWNSMLLAYVDLGKANRALLLYRQMKHEGMNPDFTTFSITLHATRILVKKEEGFFQKDLGTDLMLRKLSRAIHSDFLRKHCAINTVVANSLVSVYGKCGAVKEAENVFCGCPFKYDVISWTTMLSVYAENGYEKNALQLYKHMQEKGASPNEQTLVHALQACSILVETQDIHRSYLEIGKSLHADVIKKGYASNVFVCNTIMSMYGKCGLIKEAEDVFDGMNERTTMSLSAMVCAYVHKGLGHKALDLYRIMQEKGMILDHVILLCLIQACGAIRNVERCRHHHMEIVGLGYDRIPCIASTLIYVYGICTLSMVDAKPLFDKAIEQPDIVFWNAYIAGYACLGDHVSCLQIFEVLKKTQTKPNDVTFVSVLSACSHSGLVHRGLQYFESISKDYGLIPGLKHYSSIIEMLGQTGNFGMIEVILTKMPMEPNLTIWLALLGACCAYGNLGRAKQAFDGIMKLQSKENKTITIGG